MERLHPEVLLLVGHSKGCPGITRLDQTCQGVKESKSVLFPNVTHIISSYCLMDPRIMYQGLLVYIQIYLNLFVSIYFKKILIIAV